MPYCYRPAAAAPAPPTENEKLFFDSRTCSLHTTLRALFFVFFHAQNFVVVRPLEPPPLSLRSKGPRVADMGAATSALKNVGYSTQKQVVIKSWSLSTSTLSSLRIFL